MQKNTTLLYGKYRFSVSTHFHIQTNSYTKIDLSLSSPDCMLDFSHSVLDSLHGSDHFPIILERNAGCNFYVPLPKYKIEKADWSAFCQLTGSVPDSAAEDITYKKPSAEKATPLSELDTKKK